MRLHNSLRDYHQRQYILTSSTIVAQLQLTVLLWLGVFYLLISTKQTILETRKLSLWHSLQFIWYSALQYKLQNNWDRVLRCSVLKSAKVIVIYNYLHFWHCSSCRVDFSSFFLPLPEFILQLGQIGVASDSATFKLYNHTQNAIYNLCICLVFPARLYHTAKRPAAALRSFFESNDF